MAFSWSHSALNSFETCPRRHYEVKVQKNYVEPQGEELLWGNRVHAAAEALIKDKTPMPEEFKRYEPLVRKVVDAPGETFGERSINLDADFQPTNWRNAWLRVKIDVLKRTAKRLFAGDWKTGKFKPESDQLKITAVALFHAEPEVDEVRTAFIWLKDQRITPETYKREQLPTLWNDLLPRVERFYNAFITGRWPAKPSGLCRKHCPVKSCEFHGKGG